MEAIEIVVGKVKKPNLRIRSETHRVLKALGVILDRDFDPTLQWMIQQLADTPEMRRVKVFLAEDGSAPHLAPPRRRQTGPIQPGDRGKTAGRTE